MSEEIIRLLKQYRVIQDGHFLLTSGLHSDRYFEKFRILEHPQLCAWFANKIAHFFEKHKVDVVCGPTTGGVIVAYEVARQLACRCVIAEKAEQGRKIGRGFSLGSKDRILVVDDVLTTGSSINETVTAIQHTGTQIIGVGVFIDRSAGVSFPLPFFAVYQEPIQNFPPERCPLCRAGIPLTVPGRSGKGDRLT